MFLFQSVGEKTGKKREEEVQQSRLAFAGHATVLGEHLTARSSEIASGTLSRETVQLAAAFQHCFEKAGKPKNLREQFELSEQVREQAGAQFDEAKASIQDVRPGGFEQVQIVFRSGVVTPVPPTELNEASVRSDVAARVDYSPEEGTRDLEAARDSVVQAVSRVPDAGVRRAVAEFANATTAQAVEQLQTLGESLQEAAGKGASDTQLGRMATNQAIAVAVVQLTKLERLHEALVLFDEGKPQQLASLMGEHKIRLPVPRATTKTVPPKTKTELRQALAQLRERLETQTQPTDTAMAVETVAAPPRQKSARRVLGKKQQAQALAEMPGQQAGQTNATATLRDNIREEISKLTPEQIDHQLGRILDDATLSSQLSSSEQRAVRLALESDDSEFRQNVLTNILAAHMTIFRTLMPDAYERVLQKTALEVTASDVKEIQDRYESRTKMGEEQVQRLLEGVSQGKESALSDFAEFLNEMVKKEIS